MDIKLIILDKCHLFFGGIEEKVFFFFGEKIPTLEQFLHVCLDRAPDVDHSANRLQFLLSSRMQNKSVRNRRGGKKKNKHECFRFSSHSLEITEEIFHVNGLERGGEWRWKVSISVLLDGWVLQLESFH